ncbi:MAG: energy transducer TonB [Terracidiphilus sp.]
MIKINLRFVMRLFSVLLCLSLLIPVATAQSDHASQNISEADARQHLVQNPEPVYPPIAHAARVQGNVVLAIVIDKEGKVVSEKVISGPAMLQQAALDAVKKFCFSPFLMNGVVIRVTTSLTIPFQIDKPGEGPSAEQEKAAQAWFPLSDKCRNALKAEKIQEALDYCKQALDMSFRAGDSNSSDQLGRMDSHQLYGHALLIGGQSREALEQENLAIEESKKCLTDTDEEYAMPFFWRALVEESMGQGEPALADFKIAEDTHRRAIAHLPDMKANYSKTLASILRFHAQLLELMSRSDEAEKLRTEAASL